MKLRTSLTASRDGSLVDATDENLIHDAVAAHALMMAMEEVGAENRDYSWLACVEKIERRADEIMAGWGFDSGEDA